MRPTQAFVLVYLSIVLAAGPSTFWSDYPLCEELCHERVWSSQNCSLQNSCSGCSGCLCLADSCLCATSSWLTAVAQCIGQQCGAQAAVEAAGIAASGCGSNGLNLAIPQQQLASIGEAAAPTPGMQPVVVLRITIRPIRISIYLSGSCSDCSAGNCNQKHFSGSGNRNTVLGQSESRGDCRACHWWHSCNNRRYSRDLFYPETCSG